jgi:hypothetical protein
MRFHLCHIEGTIKKGVLVVGRGEDVMPSTAGRKQCPNSLSIAVSIIIPEAVHSSEALLDIMSRYSFATIAKSSKLVEESLLPCIMVLYTLRFLLKAVLI